MDESTFGVALERHRREQQVHCYRMLGSYEDSEDLVQETFLRAWRGRDSFQGRASPPRYSDAQRPPTAAHGVGGVSVNR